MTADVPVNQTQRRTLAAITATFPPADRPRHVLEQHLNDGRIGAWLAEALVFSYSYDTTDLAPLEESDRALLAKLRASAIEAGTYSPILPAPRW